MSRRKLGQSPPTMLPATIALDASIQVASVVAMNVVSVDFVQSPVCFGENEAREICPHISVGGICSASKWGVACGTTRCWNTTSPATTSTSSIAVCSSGIARLVVLVAILRLVVITNADIIVDRSRGTISNSLGPRFPSSILVVAVVSCCCSLMMARRGCHIGDDHVLVLVTTFLLDDFFCIFVLFLFLFLVIRR